MLSLFCCQLNVSVFSDILQIVLTFLERFLFAFCFMTSNDYFLQGNHFFCFYKAIGQVFTSNPDAEGVLGKLHVRN